MRRERTTFFFVAFISSLKISEEIFMTEKLVNWSCEYTDTFGGEANYSWVKRADFQLPQNASDRQIVARAKRELGLNGVRCRRFLHGEGFELRPFNSCTVVFISICQS
jgi:hypothetical protein